jgi:hypothetical protein
MTRDQIAKHVGLQLDVVIHPKNDLGRTLLPSMRDAGLISMDKRTWHLTEAGRRAIAEEPTTSKHTEQVLWAGCT